MPRGVGNLYIDRLEIENFKAFGDRVHIPISSVNLIFGENSSGKSSILQALYLLKQSLYGNDSDSFLSPSIEGGIFDFGSFREIIYAHDISRSIKIRLGLHLLSDVEWAFKQTSEKGFIDIENITYNCSEYSCTFRSLDISWEAGDIATLAWHDKELGIEEPLDYEINYENTMASRKPAVLQLVDIQYHDEVGLARKHKQTMDKRNRIKENIENYIKRLESMERSSFTSESKSTPSNMLVESILGTKVDKNIDKLIDHLKETYSFYSNAFSLDQYRNYLTEINKSLVLVLNDSFIPKAYRILMPFIEDEFIWANFTTDSYKPFIAEELVYYADQIKGNLDGLFPIGPFRKLPERSYRRISAKPSDVGYKGETLPASLYHNPTKIHEINAWMDQLEIGYNVEVRPIGDPSHGVFEIRLIDTVNSGNIDVSMSDVGLGISQLLPFIVQCLTLDGQIITIEQPEVHVHPRLQAKIGELINSPSATSNNIIVETHSEHLMLRLMKLVRQNKLHPDDLVVLYVSRGEKGSTVQKLDIDEDGDFIDDWPKGFFAERLEEIF